MRFSRQNQVWALLVVISLGLSSCSAPAERQNGDEDQAANPALSVETAEGEATENPYYIGISPPFREPWPTSFSRPEMVNTAQLKMFEYFDSNVTADCEFKAIVVFDSPRSDEKDIRYVADKFVEHFCEYLREDILLVIGEYEYLRQELRIRGLPTDDYGGVCGTFIPRNVGCVIYHSAWVSPTLEGTMMLQIAVHELFHIVQDSLDYDEVFPSWRREEGHPKAVPMWLIEGSAVMFHSSFIEYLGLGKYKDTFGTSSLRFPNELRPIDLKKYEFGSSQNVYNLGHYGAEYLVANTSFDQLINVWAEVGQENSFEKAFEKSFGFSIQDFYAKVLLIEPTDVR